MVTISWLRVTALIASMKRLAVSGGKPTASYPFAEKLFRREHQGVGIGLMAFNEAVLQVQHEDEVVD